MDSGYRTPLIDLFRRGDADRNMRLLGAQGALALRAHEQLALLMILLDDSDPEVASRAEATIASLPEAALSAFLARADVSDLMRGFFAARGVQPVDAAAAPPASQELAKPLLDTLDDDREAEGDTTAAPSVLSSLPVTDRLKLATKGTREQRAQLIRDPNKMVATAVLSSAKVNETEVEAFSKMANVSEDILRIIGANRSWMKHYGIAHGLARNPKTPPGISMQLLHRLTDRDVKAVAMDRNVPEALRLAARRMMSRTQK
jgi:hypothetical protein